MYSQYWVINKWLYKEDLGCQGFLPNHFAESKEKLRQNFPHLLIDIYHWIDGNMACDYK